MGAALIRQGMSVRAFAKSVGVNEAAIRQAVQNGRLADAVFGDGSLDEVAARVHWLKTTNTSRQKSPAPRSKLAGDADRARGINDVKFDKLEVELEKARLDLAEQKRTSIPYAAARKSLAGFMRLYRDICLQFAVRHGPAIAAEVGCEEGPLIAALSAHMRHALNEAASNPRPFPKVAEVVVPAEEDE
jgi:hypothetical protein